MEALTNLPSAAPGHSCASAAPVLPSPCAHFLWAAMWCSSLFTLHVLSIIFSLGAEKQLKPLLTAATSATFPGCVLLPSARARHGPSAPRRHSHSNYFPLPASRSQHELTTLQPPPKTYDSIGSTLSASLPKPFVSKSTSQPPFS